MQVLKKNAPYHYLAGVQHLYPEADIPIQNQPEP